METVGLRYEEHRNPNALLPFIYSSNINVTNTLYTRDANWHENLEIQLCLKGSGYVTLDAERVPFEEGDFIVVNTNVIHHTSTDNSINYACLIIDRKFCDEADICTTSLKFRYKIKSDALKRLFGVIDACYSNTCDPCRVAKLRSAVLDILVELRENHVDGCTEENAVKDVTFERVKKTIRFIRNNYGQKLTLDSIAKAVIVNKYVLSREFKKVTNQTIVEYINAYRCKVARDKIISGATVAEAARQCGFDNLSFFTRTFKAYMGGLPSKFK